MKTLVIKEIVTHLQRKGIPFSFSGNKELEVEGFSSLSQYKERSFSWVKKQQNWEEKGVETCPALLFVQQGVVVQCNNQIISPQSKHAFFETIDFFYGTQKEKNSIGAGSYVSDDVELGKDVVIGGNCTIDGEIRIGEGTVIGNNVVIVNRVTIGKDCDIQSLSVLGEDGFGFSEDDSGEKTMVKHHGGVVIGDRVFIGSHVNIARGTIDDTRIDNGVKIAPSTHIGHNVHIGENATVICSKLYGSVEIGAGAYLTSCTIKNQSKVGKNALVGMGAVVTSDISEGDVVVGIPARPIKRRG